MAPLGVRPMPAALVREGVDTLSSDRLAKEVPPKKATVFPSTHPPTPQAVQ
jgi:hypothetical protein